MYQLFAFCEHYPKGGMNDLVGTFYELQEVENYLSYMMSKNHEFDESAKMFYQIVLDGKVIQTGYETLYYGRYIE